MDVNNTNAILSDQELQQVLKQTVGDTKCELIKSEVRPVVENGIAGFLGDHFKLALQVKTEETEKKIHLFVKMVPKDNKIKAAMINECQFFTKETFMFKLLEDIVTPGPNPWCATTYLKNDKMIVMPDLEIKGYKTRPIDQPFDRTHVLLTSAAIANFHAAYTNFAVSESVTQSKHSDFLADHADILTETTFLDNAWNHAGALLHTKFLDEFSKKFNNLNVDIIVPLYLHAFETLRYHENTLNVLVHKDLWANNIMFKYEDGLPISALLIDFQLVRYAPPAFDVMILLYMTTTRSFREQNEEVVLRKYYTTFMDNVDENSKRELKRLNFNWETFYEWCEKARMMGITAAVLICPFGLIDAKTAEKTFNDEKTFEKVMMEDRSEPIIEYAKENSTFRSRILEIFEEFVERYYDNGF